VPKRFQAGVLEDLYWNFPRIPASSRERKLFSLSHRGHRGRKNAAAVVRKGEEAS